MKLRPNTVRDRFRKALRDVRELRQLSQTDLAVNAGFQPSAIAHFEAGRRTPTIANLVRLADALACSTDRLLGVKP